MRVGSGRWDNLVCLPRPQSRPSKCEPSLGSSGGDGGLSTSSPGARGPWAPNTTRPGRDEPHYNKHRRRRKTDLVDDIQRHRQEAGEVASFATDPLDFLSSRLVVRLILRQGELLVCLSTGAFRAACFGRHVECGGAGRGQEVGGGSRGLNLSN